MTKKSITNEGMSFAAMNRIYPTPGCGMTSFSTAYAFTPELVLFYEDRFVKMERKVTEDIRMGRNELCVCGSGKKQKNCHSNIADGSIVANVLLNAQNIDIYIEDMRKEENVTFLCESGCSDCCSEYFYISMAEYFAIRNYIETNMPSKLNRYIQLATEQMEKLKAASPKEYTRLIEKKDTKYVNNDATNLFRFEPCIFLENGNCAIYPSRPILCREFGCTVRQNPCEKIKKRLVGKPLEEIWKYMIPLIYVQLPDHPYNSFSVGSDETTERLIQFKGNPIAYWFSKDYVFSDQYNFAIRHSWRENLKQNYGIKY